ncbi:MAG TPA: hypothetical protein VGW57_15690 [Chthoniobacterales bacterium]|nr:hypothetical protein [Chthoniobacterales bacterium]
MKKIEKNRLRPGPIKCIGGASVRKITLLLTVFSAFSLVLTASAARNENLDFHPQFVFKDHNGKTVSAPIVDEYQKKKLVYPAAKVDPNMNPTLMRAATIAQERAHAHSKSRCWHYVKEALVASGAVDSRPKTALAKQAADELVRDYGFKKLSIQDPFKAPIGSILVYNARGAAGHVEIRTKNGFVSDFRSNTPSKRPLIGVYAKR